MSTTDGQKTTGQLFKEVTEDLSTLVRKEIELAKIELSQSITAKVKGAAIFAIVGVFGLFILIFALLAIRDGLATVFAVWIADLITMGALALVSLVAALIAKRMLATPISAELTKQTIKDDVEWAKTVAKR